MSDDDFQCVFCRIYCDLSLVPNLHWCFFVEWIHRVPSLVPNLHTYMHLYDTGIYIYSAWNYYEINGSNNNNNNNNHHHQITITISLVGNKLDRLLSMVQLPVWLRLRLRHPLMSLKQDVKSNRSWPPSQNHHPWMLLSIRVAMKVPWHIIDNKPPHRHSMEQGHWRWWRIFFIPKVSPVYGEGTKLAWSKWLQHVPLWFHPTKWARDI